VVGWLAWLSSFVGEVDGGNADDLLFEMLDEFVGGLATVVMTSKLQTSPNQREMAIA